MHRQTLISIAAVTLLAGTALASDGYFETDRFGYTGTVTRYGSLTDAQSGTGALDTVSIGNRDLALAFGSNDISEPNLNIMLGSWWYTTDSQGRAGWGNTTGNTGPGYLQLYDDNSSTDTAISMDFSNFNGTHYTQFDFSVSGQNANADDFSRLSVYDNVNDGGIWHSYMMNMTVTGLEGTMTSLGIIESFNQPTGVTGSITGIFEITENQTSPANQGFYAFSFDLNMMNWAWDNQGSLMTQDGSGNPIADVFSDSLFRTVPTPGSFAIIGLGAAAGLRRRRS